MAYRTALITGASSGIGEAFARALPAETDLLLTGRDEGRLAALQDELRASGERQVEVLAADLALEPGRQAVIDWALDGSRDRPLDLLINNAGLGLFGLHAENPAAREEEMVAVNCLAPVVLTRALLPGMLAAASSRQRAGIIVLASTAAYFALPRLVTYAATKAFDLQYALGLAGELHDEPVDVLALCPGPTRTAFFERAAFGAMEDRPADSAERVAREGLEALGRTAVHVVGQGNRLATVMTRFLPTRVALQGTRRWSAARARGRR